MFDSTKIRESHLFPQRENCFLSFNILFYLPFFCTRGNLA
ncbi:hypothetical protein LEP1GSC058_0442 [Leptospira fainei serovar Hurstbridge str. BUT 6]|uniref:Uncharacterized protein n=1 Tax=Leptospira fainei serovar Hurstbridge str. BUT 6 TaxID=1193011 RepID=S3W792_9LEPT|nr:hypothetical protein LEP1GSC058_0442 [Leptospira fainei serovar Hurstbridge str. BUT 6]